MRKTSYCIIGILGVVVCLAGCQARSNKEVLARIDDKYTITVGEFNERIELLPERYQELVNKNKKKFLDEFIIDTLLYNQAKEEKFQRDEDVKKLIEQAERKIMISRLLKDRVEDKATITEEEITNYYNANQDKFTMPEVRRASHILVKTDGEAREVLVELSNGRNFEDLARIRSVDPTAKSGGDIGYFTRNQLVPQVEEICFDMQVGEISDVVKTKFGYHIIKLTEKKEPHIKPLSEVHDIAMQSLLRLKKKKLFNEFVEELRERSQITINNDLLNRISLEENKEEKI